MVVPAPLREIVAARVYDAGGAPHAVDLQAFTADTAAAPAVIGFAPWSLPAPGRTLAGIEIDVEVGYGDAAADVPPPLRQAIELAGRALVRKSRADRGRAERGGAARKRGGADRALPGAVAMIDPGELNRRLVLEAPVETPTVPAAWRAAMPRSPRCGPRCGRRGAAATSSPPPTGATVTHRILIRARSELTTRHRLRDGSRIFRIVALRDQDGTGRFTEIAAEERID